MLICPARVIDCKHRSQWRHQQLLHSTVPYGRGIWEKESIIGVQWFQKNPNPRVHRSVGNSASLVSHWNGGPSGWDFSVPTEHQWWILFISTRHTYKILIFRLWIYAWNLHYVTLPQKQVTEVASFWRIVTWNQKTSVRWSGFLYQKARQWTVQKMYRSSV